MNNTKNRIVGSLAFSILFYLIWFLYDIIVYLDINNENLIVLTILFSIIDLVIILFSLFLIKNDYKVISENVNNYIGIYFMVQVTASILNIVISTIAARSILLIGVLIICIGIISTFYIANKIYEETMNLPDVAEYSRVTFAFQDAIVMGVSTLILSSIMLGLIFFGGKSILTIFVIMPFFLLTILCSYIKQRVISSFNIIKKQRIVVDNIFIIIAALMALYFSDSNMLVLDSVDKTMRTNFFGILISMLALIPLIKTNKKIGLESNKFKCNNE